MDRTRHMRGPPTHGCVHAHVRTPRPVVLSAPAVFALLPAWHACVSAACREASCGTKPPFDCLQRMRSARCLALRAGTRTAQCPFSICVQANPDIFQLVMTISWQETALAVKLVLLCLDAVLPGDAAVRLLFSGIRACAFKSMVLQTLLAHGVAPPADPAATLLPCKLRHAVSGA